MLKTMETPVDSVWLVVEKEVAPEQAMVRDVALLAKAAELSTVIFRVYNWSERALSLGRLQSTAALDMAQVEADGLAVVQRPTGGRAILHGGDLCYSVCIPPENRDWGTSVEQTYRIIAPLLQQFLRNLGVDAQVERGAKRASERFSCFGATAPLELVAAGEKLIGSAQYRSAQGVLQQGSLPLNECFRDVVRYGARSRGGAAKGVALAQLLGREPCFEELVAAFREALPVPYELF